MLRSSAQKSIGETSSTADNKLIVHDYRKDKSGNVSCHQSMVTLKCIQWNIERGYKLDKIIEILKEHHADIIILQELDIGCERSAQRDCAKELAVALEMKCVFMSEFEELHSPLRSKLTQGGGLHGNAILSRFDLEPFIVPHTHHPVDWESEGDAYREPRKGKRAILGAAVRVPGLDKPVICYSLHLEIFCGIPGRIRQFADVFDSAKEQLSRSPYQLIFGDLNTCVHGLARMAQKCARDSIRFSTFGYSEAAWWTKHIFQRIPEPGRLKPESEMLNLVPKFLPSSDVDRLVNPYFYDPFCVHSDTTYQIFRGLYIGKLDWTLLRGFRTIAKGFDNKNYSASDHKLMYVVVKPVLTQNGEDPGVVAFREQPSTQAHIYRKFSFMSMMTVASITGTVGFLLGSLLLKRIF